MILLKTSQLKVVRNFGILPESCQLVESFLKLKSMIQKSVLNFMIKKPVQASKEAGQLDSNKIAK